MLDKYPSACLFSHPRAHTSTYLHFQQHRTMKRRSSRGCPSPPSSMIAWGTFLLSGHVMMASRGGGEAFVAPPQSLAGARPSKGFSWSNNGRVSRGSRSSISMSLQEKPKKKDVPKAAEGKKELESASSSGSSSSSDDSSKKAGVSKVKFGVKAPEEQDVMWKLKVRCDLFISQQSRRCCCCCCCCRCSRQWS